MALTALAVGLHLWQRRPPRSHPGEGTEVPGRVLAGEAAIPRTLVAPLVREFQTRGRRRTVTVRRHISETVRKLGVDDRQGAVALVDGQS